MPRQEQIQRKRHARNGGDDMPDDMPATITEQSARVLSDASLMIERISRETDS